MERIDSLEGIRSTNDQSTLKIGSKRAPALLLLFWIHLEENKPCSEQEQRKYAANCLSPTTPAFLPP